MMTQFYALICDEINKVKEFEKKEYRQRIE
jgi:hypothetical protein